MQFFNLFLICADVTCGLFWEFIDFVLPLPNPDITGTGSVSGGLSKPAAPTSQVKAQMAQYNSPQALYSEENIREVLDQQSETLAGGVKG